MRIMRVNTWLISSQTRLITDIRFLLCDNFIFAFSKSDRMELLQEDADNYRSRYSLVSNYPIYSLDIIAHNSVCKHKCEISSYDINIIIPINWYRIDI